MITLSRCKKILAEEAEKYSDEEVRQIRDSFYSLAYILADHFIKNQKEKIKNINEENLSGNYEKRN